MSSQLYIEYVDLDNIKGDIYLSEYVPESVAKSKHVVPIGKKGNTLKLAVTDPLDYNTITDIGTYSKMKVDLVLAERVKIDKRIHELYVSKQAKEAAYELAKAAEMIPKQSVDFQSSDQPIVRLVNMMIDQAVNLKASDIHIEPGEENMRVRFRIDGYLVQYLETDVSITPAVVSRIKFIGGMNIAENVFLRMEGLTITTVVRI